MKPHNLYRAFDFLDLRLDRTTTQRPLAPPYPRPLPLPLTHLFPYVDRTFQANTPFFLATDSHTRPSLPIITSALQILAGYGGDLRVVYFFVYCRLHVFTLDI